MVELQSDQFWKQQLQRKSKSTFHIESVPGFKKAPRRREGGIDMPKEAAYAQRSYHEGEDVTLPTDTEFLVTQSALREKDLERHMRSATPIPGKVRPSTDIPDYDAARPMVVRFGGQNLLTDGHHRVARAKLRGEPIHVRVMDIDKHPELGTKPIKIAEDKAAAWRGHLDKMKSEGRGFPLNEADLAVWHATYPEHSPKTRTKK